MKKLLVTLALFMFIFLINCDVKPTVSDEDTPFNNSAITNLIKGGTVHRTVLINKTIRQAERLISISDFTLILEHPKTKSRNMDSKD